MTAAVVHEPTHRYLGPGLVLAERADAVTFDTVEAAEAFVARFACEPGLVGVDLAAELVAAPA